MLDKSVTHQSTPEECLTSKDVWLNYDTKENENTDVIGREAFHEYGYRV